MNAIVSLLKEENRNSFRAMYWVEYPYPGGKYLGRYKSGGHEEFRFASREESLPNLNKLKEILGKHFANVYVCDDIMLWDGNRFPVMVGSFSQSQDGKISRLF